MSSALPASRNPNKIIAVAAFAAFLATFNETFLNVAFPSIMADFGVGVSTIQWLATAYMLGAAVMIPASAFIYRSLPTRPLFLFTTALLILGSIIGALAGSFPILLTGRIIQAIGTGMMIPIGMNITLEVAPREKLGTYMGIMGAMITLGPSLSVIVAGILLSLSSWHLLLWVFAGMSLFCLLLGALLLSNVARLTHPKLDAPSMALIGIALVGILYSVSTVFFGSIPVAGITFVIGGICLYFFLRRQQKLSQPLIDLRPMKVKPFSAGVVINMVAIVITFAMNIIIPIYMQTAMKSSAMAASLALFPATLLSCVIAPIAGKVYDKHGARLLLPLGFALIFFFTLSLAFFKPSGPVLLLALLYIPVICGSALIVGPVQSYALSFLEFKLNPHGVTLITTGFQIAGCVGSSLFTGVYGAVLGKSIASGHDAIGSAASGFMTTGLLAAAFAFVGFILALRMRTFKREAAGAKATLRSIMKADVYTVDGDATLLDALSLIAGKKVSGVPVVDRKGSLMGFVSDGDILRHLAESHPLFESTYFLATIDHAENGFDQKLLDLMHIRVMDVAVKKVITVEADADLGEASRILSRHHLKKAPVMDHGRMVGIINRSNITKYAVGTLRAGAPNGH